MDSNTNLLNEDIQVDSIAAMHLKETAMWAKLMAIVGLVISILIGIFSFFAGAMIESLSAGLPAPTGSTMMVTVLYLIFAAIYFFLSLFMLRFASKMKEALLNVSQESFNVALLNQKLAYRIMGVITVLYILLLVLMMVIGLGAAMMRV